MPSESNEQNTTILLQVLASLRDDISDIRRDVAEVKDITAEVKGELMQHEMTLQQVLRQQLETNGNVRRHDGEIRDIRDSHIRDDGIAAGRKAERDKVLIAAKLATKPAAWAIGGVVGLIGYVMKDRAG